MIFSSEKASNNVVMFLKSKTPLLVMYLILLHMKHEKFVFFVLTNNIEGNDHYNVNG